MIENIYIIEDSIKKLINEFNKISKLGWINAKTKNSNEIGNNLETLLGKENNNFQIPDYDGIEIKTKRKNCYNKYITLFNCTPYGEDFFEIKRIKEKYGYSDSTKKEWKVFNGEVFFNLKKKIGNKYNFTLKINKDLKKIILVVFDLYGNIIEKSTYWPFYVLEEKLYCKLQYLALVTVICKYYKGQKYYKYKDLQIYKLKNFEAFLNCIEKRKIKVIFKIGVYKTGKRIGQIHDRGTAFQINKDYINLLYNKIYPK